MLLWDDSGKESDRGRDMGQTRKKGEVVNPMSTSGSRAAHDLIMSRRRGAILILGYIVAVVGIVVLMAVMR